MNGDDFLIYETHRFFAIKAVEVRHDNKKKRETDKQLRTYRNSLVTHLPSKMINIIFNALSST
jgi:hypothetical protein